MDDTMVTPERRRPVRVRDLMVAAVPELRDRLTEETLRRAWNQLAGAELASRSRPGRLGAGILEVIVDNSAWLHEMTLRSADLLGRIQAGFPSAVTSLKFSLGAVKRGPERIPARPDRPPVIRLSPEQIRLIDSMVSPLPDPALAGSLRRLLTRDLLARQGRAASHRSADSPPADREDP